MSHSASSRPAASARLVFVRHGESEGNVRRLLQGRLDLPLTPRGVEQARQVAEALAELAPGTPIYTSPLQRAAATADTIGRRLDSQPRPEPDLGEVDVGQATGLTWDEFAARFPAWTLRLARERGGEVVEELWPDGEPISAVRERCRRVVAGILGRHASRRAPAGAPGAAGPAGPADAPPTVVVVAHSGSVAWCLAALLRPGDDTWPAYSLPTGSISEVLLEDGQARLLRLGDARHLA